MGNASIFLEVPFYTNLELSILYKTSPNSFSIQSISSKGGLSDIHFGLVSSIFDSKSWRILGGFGFYIDTGDVTLTDSFPIYLTQSLGYPLQHGSGSFDLSMLSVNYAGRSWSFGYAFDGRFPFIEGSQWQNDLQYKLFSPYICNQIMARIIKYI